MKHLISHNGFWWAAISLTSMSLWLAEKFRNRQILGLLLGKTTHYVNMAAIWHE